MADVQTSVNQGASPNQLAGAAKYGAVGILGFLAGAGTLWSVTTREPAPIAAAQQPAPIQLAPIVVQPPQVVIQMPAQGVSPHDAPGAPPIATPGNPGAMGPNPAETPSHPSPTAQPPVATPTVSTPPSPAPTTPAPTTPAAPSRIAKLNINDATAAQLELLPGIGPSLAGRIVAYRTSHGRFGSIADLDKVDGIGPKTLERLAPLISVE